MQVGAQRLILACARLIVSMRLMRKRVTAMTSGYPVLTLLLRKRLKRYSQATAFMYLWRHGTLIALAIVAFASAAERNRAHTCWILHHNPRLE